MRPDAPSLSRPLFSSLAKAYEFMDYDVALLGRVEASALAKFSVTPDPTRKTTAEAEFSIVAVEESRSVGFYRLPSLSEGENAADDDMLKAVGEAIEARRGQVDLLVALSDWGWFGEREFLAADVAHPDMLLGSGMGSGVNGRVESDGRCLWIRPYDRGRTVVELQLLQWPSRKPGFVWSEPDTHRVLSIGLGDQYQDHPDVNAILQ